MREFLACLRAALHEVFRPSPWPEPDEDTQTPAAVRQWIAGLKHPAECAGGCRCQEGD